MRRACRALPGTSGVSCGRRFLGCFGIQRVHFLRHVVVLAGAGVGGGSLNYANTLYEPMEASFYDDPQWAALADWRSELAPYYDQAKRMLGATENPTMTPSDEAMLEVAGEMGVADSFRMASVGVAFGPPGTPPGAPLGDPYFAGAGPARRSCLECGECMTGCRHGAKNTLLTNYLYLAERAGAVVMPLDHGPVRATCRRRGLGGGHGRHRVVGGLAPRGALRGRARRAGGGGLRDPATAPRHGHGGQAPRPVPPAGPADPHQFRVVAGGRRRPGPAAP